MNWGNTNANYEIKKTIYQKAKAVWNLEELHKREFIFDPGFTVPLSDDIIKLIEDTENGILKSMISDIERLFEERYDDEESEDFWEEISDNPRD